MNQQYALTAQKVKCFHRYMARRVSKLILSLCSALWKSHPEYCVHLWNHRHKENMDLLEQIERMDTKMIRETELSPEKPEKRLRELRLFTWRRKGSYLQAAFQYSNGAYRRDEEVLAYRHLQTIRDLGLPAVVFSVQLHRCHSSDKKNEKGTWELACLKPTSKNQITLRQSQSSHNQDTPSFSVNQPYKKWHSRTHRCQGRGRRKPFCSVEELSVHIPLGR
nr:uncharacterized protein C11orf87 homolog isoform X1 [Taeniopygia guttata]XP_041571440.1 uncharacterized protein C11orf87 homolog isoform X1 [Taeniopygia guttata]